MRVVLLVACALAPLAAWSPFILDPSRLGGGILGITCLALLAVCVKQKLVPTPAPGILFMALGLLLGFIPWLGGDGSALIGGLADRAPLFAALALAALAPSLGKDLDRALPWILIGGAAAAFLGLLQVMGLDPFGWSPGPGAAPSAPLGGRNHAAEFFAVLLVAGFAGTRPWTGSNRLLGWILLPVAFQLGFLDVLAARISVPLGLAVACGRQPRRWAAAAVLLLVFAGGEIARETSHPAWAVRDPGEAGSPAFSTVTGRWNENLAGLAQASRWPLGMGLGTFEREHPAWRPLPSGPRADDPSARRAKTPHSEPLLGLLECGWVGGILLAAGLFRLLRNPSRASWTGPALAALGVHALVRSPLSDNPATLALGALLLTWPSHAVLPVRSLRGLAFLGPLVLLGAFLGPSQIMGERAVGQRMRALEDSGAFEQPGIPTFVPGGRGMLEQAIHWRPWDVRARDLLTAELAAAGESPDRIREELMHSLRLDPADLFALTGLFRIELEAGNEPLALELLDLAERVDPGHPAVRHNRTTWLDQQATRQKEGAIAQLLKGDATARPRLLAGHLTRALAQARMATDRPAEALELIHSCREALRSASFYADDHRALVERVLSHPGLDEAMVRSLVVRILPAWEPFAGPLPGN
jgi:hypothetical protein